MPRISSSTSDPLDFCTAHFPTAQTAERLYGNAGPGPDGRYDCYDYDVEHPDYGQDEYHCERCGTLLNSRDN